jgi:hypothetical protein
MTTPTVEIYYPHYCLDCQMYYHGTEPDKKRPCTRCGSRNVINGAIDNSNPKGTTGAKKTTDPIGNNRPSW